MSSGKMAEGTSTGTVAFTNVVTETKVQVSGADTGAVTPAVMTAMTLPEGDIAIIVDRVMRNLQPSVAGATPVCPALSEGEGMQLFHCYGVCGGAAMQSGWCVSQVCMLRNNVGGEVI